MCGELYRLQAVKRFIPSFFLLDKMHDVKCTQIRRDDTFADRLLLINGTFHLLAQK